MPAPMWRMNGLWRRMSGVLVLCALLLSSEVMCQTDPAVTEVPAVTGDGTTAADSTAALHVTQASTVDAKLTVSVGGKSAASSAPGNNQLPVTISNSQGGGTSGTPAAPIVTNKQRVKDLAAPNKVSNDSHVPDVKCVGKEDISESNALKVVLETTDCEETKRVIQENSEGLCYKCNLEIFQEGNTVLMAGNNARLNDLASALQRGQLKDKLGVTKTETPVGSSVFVGILVSGLLAALAITVGYLKCPRKSDTKGVRLAEEAYPVDQENQGNTLVSVAPLNPPTETPEKPSVNGESPEAAKTQPPPPPPPTNGHSTTKTADTEL